MDKKRKRLLAAIFGYCQRQGITDADIDYVKGIACRAAKVERFNQIDEATLRRLYNRFRSP